MIYNNGCPDFENNCDFCDIDFSDIANDFTKVSFDTYKDCWDDIEISLANDKKHCFIHKKGDKRTLINEFKLSNNPKVNIFCVWNFFQNKNSEKFIARPIFYKMNTNNQNSTTTKEKVRIAFEEGEVATKFWEMIAFIQGFNNLVDLGRFENKYRVISKEQLLSTLNAYNTQEQIDTISEFIKDLEISYRQSEKLLGAPKERSLIKFKELLDSETTKEDDWQHFFEENTWIFAGISLKLFFLRGIIPQANIGTPNTQGRCSPIADFLCIDDYTTLVELKRPDTPIFTKKRSSTARTDTWSWSSDFIDGITQCLAQKVALVKSADTKNFTTKGGKLIQVNIRDPKIIFIIGNKKQFACKNIREEDKIKADTFESYRRDHRNIEIITYDELYERAYYIVYDQKPPKSIARY